MAARKTYKTAASDNSRWDRFVHRPGDIFVCTPPKCGTTWMQTIVASLLWPDGNAPGPVMVVSPWLDARFEPIHDVLARLDAQEHRRFIKTHTPADGIPWFDTGSYIAVLRDGRDAFMSYANHILRFRDEVRGPLNEQAAAEGVPLMPGRDLGVHELFDGWVANPMPAVHLATWWPRRDLPNVLLVHYNDLLADLEGEMRRVAAFLGAGVPEADWPAVVERCTFAGMRTRASAIGDFDAKFEGGAESFLFKGTNGRWRDVLTDEELDRYERRLRELLDDDAIDWLEHGRLPASR